VHGVFDSNWAMAGHLTHECTYTGTVGIHDRCSPWIAWKWKKISTIPSFNMAYHTNYV
jgi:hypothetical protein